jgi:hypothetical protein
MAAVDSIGWFNSIERMAVPENTQRWFAGPLLTQKRIWFAYVVAVITDGIQIGLGPMGWAFIDEGLDVLAMLLIMGALGFHVLLLPTFVLELLPVADMLPTWTGCTAAVVLLRKRAQSQSAVGSATVLSPPALPPPSQTPPGTDKPPKL